MWLGGAIIGTKKIFEFLAKISVKCLVKCLVKILGQNFGLKISPHNRVTVCGWVGPSSGRKKFSKFWPKFRFDIIQHHPASSDLIRNHPTSSGIIRHRTTASVQHHPTSWDIIRHHPTSSGIIQASSGIIQHHPSSTNIIRHRPTSSGITQASLSGINQHHPASSNNIRHQLTSSGIIFLYSWPLGLGFFYQTLGDVRAHVKAFFQEFNSKAGQGGYTWVYGGIVTWVLLAILSLLLVTW
jgi:hypothetical protein